ncbi:MAG: hypothetical protein ACK49R_07685, partial [Planctomycetota bacterium]
LLVGWDKVAEHHVHPLCKQKRWNKGKLPRPPAHQRCREDHPANAGRELHFRGGPARVGTDVYSPAELLQTDRLA